VPIDQIRLQHPFVVELKIWNNFDSSNTDCCLPEAGGYRAMRAYDPVASEAVL
jgi:hypothetical protein